jgi:AcrR family transcriptional regulator
VADDTRTRIIQATNELFRTHGYHATSLSEISAAAPATIGSIYHFFPGGKESLAVAVIESTGGAYRELFESIVAGSSDAASGFAAFFAGAAQVLVETDFIDPCPIGTVAREVASTSEPLRRAAEAVFESWVGAAADFLVRAGVADGRAVDLATLFVTTIEGCFVVSRTRRSTAPIDAVARVFTPLVAAAVREADADRASSGAG